MGSVVTVGLLLSLARQPIPNQATWAMMVALCASFALVFFTLVLRWRHFLDS